MNYPDREWGFQGQGEACSKGHQHAEFYEMEESKLRQRFREMTRRLSKMRREMKGQVKTPGVFSCLKAEGGDERI